MMLPQKLKKNHSFFRFFICIIPFIISSNLLGQGATCENIQPFCADTGSSGITFRNTSNGTTAQNGPDYNCLVSQPNPAWYYFQIDTGGDLDLVISQNTQTDGLGTGLDVDYIIWGPFNNTSACSASDLSAENIVDCSYLPDNVEYASIPNTVSGEIYIIVITNFDGRAGFISLETIPGGATTDCSIVAGNLGEDMSPCEGETIVLDGTTNDAVSYSWSRDGILLTDENTPTLSVTTSGTYQITATDSNGNSGSDEIIISYTEKPTPNTIDNIAVCSDNKDANGNTIGVFDLSLSRENILAAMSPESFILTYHTSQDDADLGVNAIPENYTTTITSQQLFVRVENVLNAACADTSISFNLILNSNPETETITDLVLCDDSTDGDNTNGILQHINLREKDAEIIAGRTDLSINYFKSKPDAIANLNPLNSSYTNTASTEIIHFRLANLANECFSVGEFNLNVVSGVTVLNTTLEQCDTADGRIDGLALFNLEDAKTSILNNEDIADYTFSFFLSQEAAENNTNPQNAIAFSNTAANQVIYALVSNKNTGCSAISEITLATSNREIPTSLLMACSDSGFSGFNLNDADFRLLDSSIPATATISYYETSADAQLEINPLSNLYTNTVANTQMVYARIEDEGSCFAIAEILLTVDALPSISLEETILLCVDQDGNTDTPALINTGLSTTNYSFIWERNGVILTNEATETLSTAIEGNYTVTVTDLLTGCQNSGVTTIRNSSAPFNVSITSRSAAFSSENSVTIAVEGYGNYEYQANDGTPQTSPVFTNLSSGNTTITVSDTNGCGSKTIEIFLVDYPRFFTPNGDNVNDTWNMPKIALLRDASITIYDCYGSMLKAITPEESGWDGTVNGKQLPETDYWFNMVYVEENTTKQLKGHFSLKR